MCSTYADEDRFVTLINDAIAAKTLPSFPAWKKAIKNTKGKAMRLSKGKAEELEAEKYARELGVYDQLNGKGKGKGKGKNGKKGDDDEAGLRALIQGNQAKKMDAMFDSIAAKYEAKEDRKQKRRSSDESDSGAAGAKGKKKKVVQAEPSEEEFRKLQEAMEARRKGNGEASNGKKKGRKSS